MLPGGCKIRKISRSALQSTDATAHKTEAVHVRLKAIVTVFFFGHESWTLCARAAFQDRRMSITTQLILPFPPVKLVGPLLTFLWPDSPCT